MRGPTVLARILLDNKKFRAQLRGTAKGAAADFKRYSAVAIAATATLTFGLARAREKYLAVAKAGALASATFGKDVTKVSRLLAGTKIGKDAEEVAAAFDLLARMGADSAEEAATLIPQFDALSKALGIDLLSTIDVVGSALRAMGIPITDVSKHSDAFALVARKTTVDVADFSTAIAANAREMKSMGKTVEDAAAAVLGLHARGMGGAEAVKTLTEAIQDGAVFSELWTERLGLSGQTIDILRARIGETNRETLIYAESVSNASDRIESLKKLVGEALAPALWEAIKSMEAGDVAAKTLGGGLGVAYTAAQKLFDGIGSMKEVPQAFAGFSDDVVRRLNEIALAADAAWAAVRRLHSEQGGKVGSATDLGTGVTSPIYAPPRPPDKPGLPPPTTSAAILPPVVNMPAAPRDAHAAYTSAAIANYLNGGVVKGFSSGGIVRDDGLAMLHGPEAVLPLDRLTPMMAEALAAAMSGWSGGGARGVDATTGAPSGGTTIVIHNLHLQDIRGLEQALRARGYVG